MESCQNCNLGPNPYESNPSHLSQAEQYSLWEYVFTLRFSTINQGLILGQLTKADKAYKKVFMKALRKMPLTKKSQILYRGTSCKYDLRNSKSFWSTSTEKGVAESFMLGVETKPCLLVISGAHAYDISDYGTAPEGQAEREAIILPGSKFRVTKKTENLKEDFEIEEPPFSKTIVYDIYYLQFEN